jgi:hypothetical protein
MGSAAEAEAGEGCMSYLSKAVEEAAADLVRSGALDDAIFGIVEDRVRSGPDDGLTETGFVLKMTVAMIDASNPRLSFRKARKLAGRAYAEFLRDNKLTFGADGWDWSGVGARIVAGEYEIDHWERAA